MRIFEVPIVFTVEAADAATAREIVVALVQRAGLWEALENDPDDRFHSALIGLLDAISERRDF